MVNLEKPDPMGKVSEPCFFKVWFKRLFLKYFKRMNLWSQLTLWGQKGRFGNPQNGNDGHAVNFDITLSLEEEIYSIKVSLSGNILNF